MDRIKTTILYHHDTVIISAAGRENAHEWLAVEKPYTVALNDRDIGTAMVLETGLEEFGAGFLFGQGYVEGPARSGKCLSCPRGGYLVHADVDEDAGAEGTDHYLGLRRDRQNFTRDA